MSLEKIALIALRLPTFTNYHKSLAYMFTTSGWFYLPSSHLLPWSNSRLNHKSSKVLTRGLMLASEDGGAELLNSCNLVSPPYTLIMSHAFGNIFKHSDTPKYFPQSYFRYYFDKIKSIEDKGHQTSVMLQPIQVRWLFYIKKKLRWIWCFQLV